MLNILFGNEIAHFVKVPYPLPKLDMLCVTEFAMGAMENWGLVTYRETALMIDEKKASSQAKQRVAIVVAHELAHQVTIYSSCESVDLICNVVIPLVDSGSETWLQ